MREVVKSFDLRRFISLGGPSKPLEHLTKPKSTHKIELGKEEEWVPKGTRIRGLEFTRIRESGSFGACGERV